MQHTYVKNQDGVTYGDVVREISRSFVEDSLDWANLAIQGGGIWHVLPWSIDDITGHEMLHLLRMDNEKLMSKIKGE